jgi:hypothetical protein
MYKKEINSLAHLLLESEMYVIKFANSGAEAINASVLPGFASLVRRILCVPLSNRIGISKTDNGYIYNIVLASGPKIDVPVHVNPANIDNGDTAAFFLDNLFFTITYHSNGLV